MSPVATDTAKRLGRLEQHERWLVLMVFLLALALRLYAVSSFPAVPVADAADYHRLATGLAAGRGYVGSGGARTAWRPPGYSVFLAGVYTLCGAHPQAAYLTQAVLGSVAVALLMLLGSLILGSRQALLSGMLAAVYPGFCWLPRTLLSENLVLPLLILALCVATLLIRTYQPGWAAALGVTLGLSVLVRGTIFLVAILLLAGLVGALPRQQSRWQGLALPCLVLGCVLVVLLPWGVRNYLVFHRSVPVATQDGMALYASYWPPHVGSKRLWGNLPGAEDPAVAAAYRVGDEAAVSEQLRAITFRRLLEQPGYFFRLIPAKLISLAAPFDWEWFPHRPGSSRSVNVGYLLLLVSALLGAWALRRRPVPDQWLLWVLPVAVVVQSVIFYGSPRFRLPAETTAILLASVGVTWVLSAAQERGRSLAKWISRVRSPCPLPGASLWRQH